MSAARRRLSRLSVESPLANFVVFQSIWISCIFGQANLIIIPATLLALHLWLTSQLNADLLVIAVVAPIGIAIDSALTIMGIFIFNEPTLVVPFWLMLLWCGFATCLNCSFRPLWKFKYLTPVLGGIGGTLSYWTGMRLGAVEFGLPLNETLFILFVAWGIKFPLFLYLNSQLRNVFRAKYHA